MKKIIYKNSNGSTSQIIPTSSIDLAIKDVPTGVDYEIVDINHQAKISINDTNTQAKEAKLDAVSQITVTTALGKVFDGDEISQNRMARAVTASNAGDTTQWILADNTQATVTHEELKEALLLAGEATIKIWMA